MPVLGVVPVGLTLRPPNIIVPAKVDGVVTSKEKDVASGVMLVESKTISLVGVIAISELVSNSQPVGKLIVWMPVAISPFSVPKLGPPNDFQLGLVPAEDVSIEIFVPLPTAVTVAAAKAELGAKNPPATSAMAVIKKDVPLRK